MRALPLGAAALAGVGALWSAPALAPFVPPAAAALRIRTRLRRPRGVALTFDDGPHRDGTPAVLEQLDRAAAVATFFLVGEQVERLPTLAAEIVAAGHEIALHGYLHRLLLARRSSALGRDLDQATAVIEDATGRSPVCYRPPYGVFSIGALDLVRRRGLEPVLWSRWGCDWRARETPEGIAKRVTRRLQAGDVVLLHDADHYSSFDSWRKTVAALPAIVESVAALSEPFVPVTQST